MQVTEELHTAARAVRQAGGVGTAARRSNKNRARFYFAGDGLLAESRRAIHLTTSAQSCVRAAWDLVFSKVFATDG